MAKDIYLDPNTNDISLVNGTMRVTSNIEESSRQQVQINLGMFKGEWFANVLAGIPYLKNDYNGVQLLGAADKTLIDVAIREGITSRENITQIIAYDSTVDTNLRELSVSFEALTRSGEVVSIEDLTINI